ncbi:MAG: hypothetical protein QOG69_409, partial [Actinomycetota bacterium]|nr:hypothetical protein [Actinomycetota bacterium]
MTAATRPTQVRALDGIRGIAVLLVMAYHCELMGTDQKAYQFLRGGWAGVDIFFVLSGYLITSGLIAGPTIGTQLLRPFYARRLRRLAPAALALLTVWLVLSLTGLVPVVWLGHPPGSSKLLLALA